MTQSPNIQFPDTEMKRAEDDTLVVETGAGKFQLAIDSAGHALRSDEPKDHGGDNTGPDPYDLLLSALGACTAMTLRMYADFKKLPLDRVAVRLSHDKIHAKDCRDCENKDGMVDIIEREIELTGPDLTTDQRQRLLEIANKCPVHRTLTSEVKIRSRLLEV